MVAIDELQSHDAISIFNVGMAAWFHDFIYNPRLPDNESASAIAANTLLARAGVSERSRSQISNLILATGRHDRSDLLDRDTQILLDADLAILGATPAIYHEYSRAIRQEYNWVEAVAYRSGRQKVLSSFLRRDRIYYTDLFHRKLEAIARTNLITEIDRLN
jgi:predicted metal-dependent HD superfamily phosphohydrolase